MKRLAIALALAWPGLAAAEGVEIHHPMVPLAPPGVMAHAAYMVLENTGSATRSLVAVSAEGYAMAHLHVSREVDGVATMSALDQLDIAPGQSVALKQGGLHIMLMRPDAPLTEGGSVALKLTFANGEVMAVAAQVMKMDMKKTGHDHGA